VFICIHCYSYFQTPFAVKTLVLCYTRYCTHYIQLNKFQTCAGATETFHVLSVIATVLFPYHMFGLPFPLNSFLSASYVCILCAFQQCVTIIPCNFNSPCLFSNTQLWPLLGVCNAKNDGSVDICVSGRYIKVFVE